MAAYLVVDTLLEDPEGYEAYKLQAKPLVEQFGGEYLARGGAMTIVEDDLWSPTRCVLVRFPDADAARRFYDSPEYAPIKALGRRSAKRTIFVLEGL
jgi:uncharacterized protein (DUF1330 family)